MKKKILRFYGIEKLKSYWRQRKKMHLGVEILNNKKYKNRT